MRLIPCIYVVGKKLCYSKKAFARRCLKIVDINLYKNLLVSFVYPRMLHLFKMAHYILFTYTIPSRALSLKLTSLFTEVRPREKREGFAIATRDGENRLVHVRSFPREKESSFSVIQSVLKIIIRAGKGWFCRAKIKRKRKKALI